MPLSFLTLVFLPCPHNTQTRALFIAPRLPSGDAAAAAAAAAGPSDPPSVDELFIVSRLLLLLLTRDVASRELAASTLGLAEKLIALLEAWLGQYDEAARSLNLPPGGGLPHVPSAAALGEEAEAIRAALRVPVWVEVALLLLTCLASTKPKPVPVVAPSTTRSMAALVAGTVPSSLAEAFSSLQDSFDRVERLLGTEEAAQAAAAAPAPAEASGRAATPAPPEAPPPLEAATPAPAATPGMPPPATTTAPAATAGAGDAEGAAGGWTEAALLEAALLASLQAGDGAEYGFA